MDGNRMCAYNQHIHLSSKDKFPSRFFLYKDMLGIWEVLSVGISKGTRQDTLSSLYRVCAHVCHFTKKKTQKTTCCKMVMNNHKLYILNIYIFTIHRFLRCGGMVCVREYDIPP